jgi:uncharacterized membrane protein
MNAFLEYGYKFIIAPFVIVFETIMVFLKGGWWPFGILFLIGWLIILIYYLLVLSLLYFFIFKLTLFLIDRLKKQKSVNSCQHIEQERRV